MHNSSVVCLNKNWLIPCFYSTLETIYGLCEQGLADFDLSPIFYPFLPFPMPKLDADDIFLEEVIYIQTAKQHCANFRTSVSFCYCV